MPTDRNRGFLTPAHSCPVDAFQSVAAYYPPEVHAQSIVPKDSEVVKPGAVYRALLLRKEPDAVSHAHGVPAAGWSFFPVGQLALTEKESATKE